MSKKKALATNGNESNNVSGHSTKKDAILAVLHIRSLNRFEAEQYGDHCLHSTISELRNDGHLFYHEWEVVPTRWGKDARVKRYYLLRGAR